VTAPAQAPEARPIIRPSLRPSRGDALIAASTAVVAAIGTGVELAGSSFPYPPQAPAYLLALAACAALLWRRRHPFWVSVLVLVLVLAYHFAGYPGQAPALALYVALYSLAAHGSTRVSVIAAFVFSVAWAVPLMAPPHALDITSWPVLGPFVLFIAVIVLGLSVRRSRVASRMQAEHSAALTEARVRNELAEERLGMARELHDVLAHTISVISVQSGVALDALDTDPAAARDALKTVRVLARQAIPELRGTLELLRSDARTTPLTQPQPGLAQLADLAALARGAGLEVELTPVSSLPSLAPYLELTVYRIVQESVTNVIRHASATAVSIGIDVVSGRVHVDVVDDGRGSVGALSMPGMGVRGMRERVHALGGEITAEGEPGGGFAVHAWLPAGDEP
jgi:signal transduction histidine kinase